MFFIKKKKYIIHFNFKEILPENVMKEEVKKFGERLNVVTATYASKNSRINPRCASIKTVFDYIYYYFATKKASKQCKMFYSHPDPQTAISVFFLNFVNFYSL